MFLHCVARGFAIKSSSIHVGKIKAQMWWWVLFVNYWKDDWNTQCCEGRDARHYWLQWYTQGQHSRAERGIWKIDVHGRRWLKTCTGVQCTSDVIKIFKENIKQKMFCVERPPWNVSQMKNLVTTSRQQIQNPNIHTNYCFKYWTYSPWWYGTESMRWAALLIFTAILVYKLIMNAADNFDQYQSTTLTIRNEMRVTMSMPTCVQYAVSSICALY